MLLGAHVSISGGYLNALTEAQRIGADTIQIFTKNQRFWREKEISEDEGLAFRKAMRSHGVKQAFSHAIYLISLGSENDEIVEKSLLSLAMELRRCETLGLTHTVLHPGAAGTATVSKAIRTIGDRIKTVLKVTGKSATKILLENTAGSGTSVGGKMEYIGELIHYINSPRVGMCLDTCHAFAAGYDIRTPKGVDGLFKEIDLKIGLDKLLCFHLNDSKGGLGSKIDRHAHIGEGLLGLAPFRYIMRHFQDRPKVTETSKENDADLKNLTLLRSLAGKK